MKPGSPPALADLARARWLEGRARYGSEWVGQHPLLELYEELADALNYEEEARARGCTVPALRSLLEESGALVATALRDLDREPTNTEGST